jgi:hypothetical protein
MTEHCRFAVSVNLNEGYEGGEIGFPEYGPQLYRPGAGAALVFSCSLLHGISPITLGRRYAFLPFLHDDAADLILERNHGQSTMDDQITPPPTPKTPVPPRQAEAWR